MLVDLHVHADAATNPDALLARARTLGLEGLAVVGDDGFPDLAPLRAAAGTLPLFAGAEVTTDRGHYLVFVPRPELVPSMEQLFGERVDGTWPVRDVVVRTRAVGGAVVAAHPYDPAIEHPGGDILFTLPSIHAVESVNGRHPQASPHAAIEAAETLGLPCVGGSDARTTEELGRAATLFAERLADEVDLVEALRAGTCWPVDFAKPAEHLTRRAQSGQASEPRPQSESGAPREGGGGGNGGRRRRRRR